MFGLEDELYDENVKLMGTIRALEETVAELREELKELEIIKDNALEDLQTIEEFVEGIEDWFRSYKHNKVSEE